MTTTDNTALPLFMVWQDAAELGAFLSLSKLTPERFASTPLDRASVCELLGVIGIHAHGIEPQVADTIPSIDWPRVRGLSALADDQVRHTLNDEGIEAAWEAATVTCRDLFRTLDTDERVVAIRARWDELMAREPADWPQPSEATSAPGPLIEKVIEAAKEVAGEDFPARGLWLFGPWTQRDATGTPVSIAVDHQGACDTQHAKQLHDGLRRKVNFPIGLMPLEQIHPLLWDELVSTMVCVWGHEADADNHTVPVAAHKHEHGHHHDHAE